MEILKEILFVIGVIPVAFIMLVFREELGIPREDLVRQQLIAVVIQLTACFGYILL